MLQNLPLALAFSDVTLAWGSLPGSPVCALAASLTLGSARASGSLSVGLLVGCVRERASCKGHKSHKCLQVP